LKRKKLGKPKKGDELGKKKGVMEQRFPGEMERSIGPKGFLGWKKNRGRGGGLRGRENRTGRKAKQLLIPPRGKGKKGPPKKAIPKPNREYVTIDRRESEALSRFRENARKVRREGRNCEKKNLNKISRNVLCLKTSEKK